VCGDRYVIVMFIVIEKQAYLNGFRAGVTVMTMMTLIYGLILKSGACPLPKPLPLQPNPTNPTLGASSPVPMRSLRPLAASGLSNLPDNPTLLPDDGLPFSSGW
jgi:hypothetical protein